MEMGTVIVHTNSRVTPSPTPGARRGLVALNGTSFLDPCFVVFPVHSPHNPHNGTCTSCGLGPPTATEWVCS